MSTVATAGAKVVAANGFRVPALRRVVGVVGAGAELAQGAAGKGPPLDQRPLGRPRRGQWRGKSQNGRREEGDAHGFSPCSLCSFCLYCLVALRGPWEGALAMAGARVPAPPAPGGRAPERTTNDDMRPLRVPCPVDRADTAEKPRAQSRSGAPPGLNILCQVFANGTASLSCATGKIYSLMNSKSWVIGKPTLATISR